MWFVEHGFSAVGVDNSKRMIEVARASDTRPEYYEMDILQAEFPDGSFDGIWCSCVLLHIRRASLTRAVGELARLLRPSGILYVLVKEGDGEGIEKMCGTGEQRSFRRTSCQVKLVALSLVLG